ncbi:hypothetical protein L1D53_26210 [Vibrio alginolyticus]|nr:hypothetical protein [Vibrio alginolyticus]
MDSTITKPVFEFAGSNANILNNLIGHSMSIDNKKCGKGSGTDGTFNLAVVGIEVIGGGSNLIQELDYTDIGDKFEKWAKLAGKANAAFAVISVAIKFKEGQGAWHERITSGDLLTISGAVLGAIDNSKKEAKDLRYCFHTTILNLCHVPKHAYK